MEALQCILWSGKIGTSTFLFKKKKHQSILKCLFLPDIMSNPQAIAIYMNFRDLFWEL